MSNEVKVSVRWPALPFGHRFKVEDVAIAVDFQGPIPNMVRNGMISQDLLPYIRQAAGDGGLRFAGLLGLAVRPGAIEAIPTFSFRREGSHMIQRLAVGVFLVVLREGRGEGKLIAESRRLMITGLEDDKVSIDIAGGTCVMVGAVGI